MVDWELAARIGARAAGPGPVVSAAEADEAVAELRDGANRSTGLVAEFTGLEAAWGEAPVLVVDRAGWVRANADSFARVIDPLASRLTDGKPTPSGIVKAVGSRVTAAEVGGLLGFLGGKVLGQFDPFHEPAGRLLLVAPNVVHVERELRADPHDFRLWVCLHEETHRVQFTAVPWMRQHLFSLMDQVVGAVQPDTMVADVVSRASQLVRATRGTDGERGGSLLELIGSPEQRALIDQVTGVMSLLEGHADVVMDGVGPEVIGSVASIRSKFNARRGGTGTLDRLLRRLLGLDAKMAQYRDGAAFVRTVIDQVGMEGFNAVWADPSHLPTKDEIHAPATWVARVHG